MIQTGLLAGFMGGWGMAELVVLALIGLLIFGRRLPEVGKSLGKGIVEFKKGLAGVEDEIVNGSRPQQQVGSSEAPAALPPAELAAKLESAEAEVRRLTEQLKAQGQASQETSGNSVRG